MVDGWFVCVYARVRTSLLVLYYWIVSVVAPEQATVHITSLLLAFAQSMLAVVATSVSLLLATIQQT